MKKSSKFIVLMILLSLSIILTSCGSKKNMSAEDMIEEILENDLDNSIIFNDSYKQNTEDLGYVFVEAQQESDGTIDVENPNKSVDMSVKEAYLDGDLLEKDYHMMMISIGYDPTNAISHYGNTLVEGQFVNLSLSIRWLLRNEDQLSDNEKSVLKKAIIDFDSEDLTSASINLKDEMTHLISPTVYAESDERITKTLSEVDGFKEKVKINYKKSDVDSDRLVLLENVIRAAGSDFLDIFDAFDTPILFALNKDVPGMIMSKNYMVDGHYIIEMNNNLTDYYFIGSLVEEIFYAYTDMYFEEPDDNFPIEWLRKAMSTWGVNHVFKDFNYEHQYVHNIYVQDATLFYLGSENQIRAWYTYFLYVSEVTGKANYVKDIMTYCKTHPGDTDLNHILAADEDELWLRKAFAGFSMYLVGADETTGDLKDVDDVEHYIFLPHKFIKVSELKNMKLSKWELELIQEGGMFLIQVDGTDLGDEDVVHILNNMSLDGSTNMGMCIGLYDNGKTKWKMGATNELPFYDVDKSKQPLQNIKILLYNANMNKSDMYAYAMSIGGMQQGTGSLKVNYTIKSTINGKTTLEKIQWTADEKLEKLKTSASGDMAGLMSALTGTSYSVEEFAMDYAYSYEESGDEPFYEEKVNASGVYFYDSTDEAAGGFSLEDILSGGNESGGLNNQIGDLLDQAAALPGMEDIPVLDEDMQALLDDGMSPETLGLSEDEYSAAMDLISAMDRIYRVRYDGANSSLMLFPAMPPGFLTEEWIDGTGTVKTKDAAGNIVTDAYDVEFSPTEYSDIFPQWFVNPEAQGVITELPGMSQDELSKYADVIPYDMKEIMDKIQGVSSAGNGINVMTMNQKGVMTIEVGGYGNGGTLIQLIDYDGKSLIAKLTWVDIIDGATHTCEVEMLYSFE